MYAPQILHMPHIWFTFARRHHCPACKSLLCRTLAGETMPMSEARKRRYDTMIDDCEPMAENVRIYSIRFKCEICGAEYGVEEMIRIEKNIACS